MRGICRYSGKYHSESDTAGITFGNGIYDIGILFDVIYSGGGSDVASCVLRQERCYKVCS